VIENYSHWQLKKKMLTNAARSASLRGDIISTISEMDYEELSSLFQYVRCSSIRSEWTGVDLSATFPEDALNSIASFLDSKSLSTWQSCSSSMLSSFDSPWYQRGMDRFRNILVDGEAFANSESVISSWFTRFIEFSRNIKISPKDRVLEDNSSAPKVVATCIPLYQKVSCTVPAQFSIQLSGTTYITMTMSLRFSPEAVRSVVGLIQAPLYPLPESSLECDRGLSRKYWGLSFGPLTGVVSTQGRYFDDFSTYRARHGLKDYLSLALKETVTVQVGMLIHEGKIAFYRLPESDYPDWECTGFVYDCFENSTKSYFNFLDTPSVHPSVMFSHIGHRDHIAVSIDSISDQPVYWPHENERAKDFSNWRSFAADRIDGEFETQIPTPPPTSPMSMDMDDYPNQVVLVSQRDA
jgi:hypothetical protein